MKLKLFTDEESKFATDYVLHLEESKKLKNEKEHRFGPDNHKSYKLYKDDVFLDLALKALPKLEEGYGVKLYPTYTYTRLYKPGFRLLPHVDRPSCEFSSTVTMGFGDRDFPWEIYIENENEDGKEYILYPGEGVLYEGRKYHHWRMPLDKGWQVQTFVHYIEVEGEVYNKVLDYLPDFDFSIPFTDFRFTKTELFINEPDEDW